MAGYRFCRSDDVGLLVEAYNACFRVHHPGLPPLTVDGFKRLIRELNLWTSSCMVASVNGQPIGVMLAAKRDGDANWIHSLGVQAEYQRQGHGRHLLTSLGRKLAILGPRRVLLELPARAEAARRFVEACGYSAEVVYTDFTRPAATARRTAPEVVIPTSLEELLQTEAFDRGARRCWERSPATLVNLGERLEGLAIASGERVEAYVLYDDEAEVARRRIMAFEVRTDDPLRAERMLAILFDACAGATSRPLYLPRVSSAEAGLDRLPRWGFAAGEQTVGYCAEAQPG